MKIAIPVEHGHLHYNFGRCRQFVLLDLDTDKKLVLRTDNASSPECPSGLLPRWLREQGVQLVITAGIGPRALEICGRCGIAVRAGTAGAPVEQLVAAYLNGELMGAPKCEPRPHNYPL